MGYYMGDYMAGDFYRGDPGFFSILGRLGKAAVGSIPGVGPAAEAIMRIGRPAAKVGTIAAAGAAAGGLVRRAGAEIVQHPVLSAAGAAGAVGLGGVLAGRAMAPGAICPRGVHLTRPQRIPRHPEPHLAKNRRMNVCNHRALNRAIRRAHGFARKARKVLAFTSPHRPKGRMYFRKRRKSK